jgi:hypothetical protein
MEAPVFNLSASKATAVGIALALASLIVERPFPVALCLCAAAILICSSIVRSRYIGFILKTILCISVFAVAFYFYAVRENINLEKSLLEYRGTLFAGHEPTPEFRCEPPPPPGAVGIWLGQSAGLGWTPSGMIRIISISGMLMLAIERKVYSYLIGEFSTISVVLLEMYDDRGDNIVHIGNDYYWVNPLLRFERKNMSTLAVFDHRGGESLGLEYLNPSAITLTGKFRSRDGRTLVSVEPDAIRRKRAVISKVCGSYGFSIFSF